MIINRNMYPLSVACDNNRGCISFPEEAAVSPSTAMARAVFGETPIQADVPPQPGLSASRLMKKQWKQSIEMASETLKSYGLDAGFRKGGGYESSNSGWVPQQNFNDAGNKVYLVCRRCAKNKINSPIAIGQLYICEETGQGGIKVDHLYFHDVNCCNDSDAPLGVDVSKYQCNRIDTDRVFSETYDKAVAHIDTHHPSYNHTTNRNNVDSDSPSPPGSPAVVGTVSPAMALTKTDRMVELIPSPHYSSFIEPPHHNLAMLRFLYLFCVSMNLTEQMAPYLCKPNQNKKQKGRLGQYGVKEHRNPNCHLYFTDVAIIMGGHSFARDLTLSQEPIHMDGPIVKDDFPYFAPGTVVAPLSALGRSVFMYAQTNIVKLQHGHYCFYSSNVPHGDCSLPYGEQGWAPALHIRLASMHVSNRKKAPEVDERPIGLSPRHFALMNRDAKRRKCFSTHLHQKKLVATATLPQDPEPITRALEILSPLVKDKTAVKHNLRKATKDTLKKAFSEIETVIQQYNNSPDSK